MIENNLKDWFTWKGRLPRSRFLLRYLVFGVIYTLLFSEWEFHVDTYKVITFLTVPGYVTLIFGGGALFLAFTIVPLIVRRFHDLGKSGLYFWLSLIPLVNLYYGFLLIFKRGDQGSNRFGDEVKGLF